MMPVVARWPEAQRLHRVNRVRASFVLVLPQTHVLPGSIFRCFSPGLASITEWKITGQGATARVEI